MSKGIQLWPGDRMRAFFRGHIRRETALDTKSTEKLVEALTKATNRMLVWGMPEEAPARPAAASGAKAKTGPANKDEKGKDEKAFDPYAFSAMVVLAKQGRDGLAKRLAEIRSADHLRKLAEAQHLGIDKQVTKLDELRKAILAATEQRLADRRAAAS